MLELVRFVRNIASRNGDRRLRALKTMSEILIPDFRLTAFQMEWWHDTEFNQFLERFAIRNSFSTHRKWTLWQMMRLVWDIKGDTAECGVYQGASSWLICSANRGRGRCHHVFDSFEGLSAPASADGDYWRAGALAASEELVRENLKLFEKSVVFHKGWIPERFSDVEGKTFAFVHVDVDLYQPTKDSIEFFYSRLARGGVFLCDDYGCSTCPGATEAVDSFLIDKPEKMISLDAGGGFFVKGIRTAPAMSSALVEQE